MRRIWVAAGPVPCAGELEGAAGPPAKARLPMLWATTLSARQAARAPALVRPPRPTPPHGLRAAAPTNWSTDGVAGGQPSSTYPVLPSAPALRDRRAPHALQRLLRRCL